MTPYEQKLLEEYLTHLNVIGDEGDYTDFEAWYRTVRYAEGPTPRPPSRRPRRCATRTSWMPPVHSSSGKRLQLN